MRNLFTILVFTFSTLIAPLIAQDFDGTWQTDYVTDDDGDNGTGLNTISVGVISENAFVGLVNSDDDVAYYLVGYANADSSQGRLGSFEYNTSQAQQWVSGFEFVDFEQPNDLEGTPDSLIYMANNDDEHNILVFKMTVDTVISTSYRLKSNADSLWAIDVDDNGFVYVSSITDSGTANEILVFNGIENDPEWSATTHNGVPVTTITMPAAGEIRGIAVNPEGTIIYASNYTTKEIYCFIGDPQNGYTQYTGFNFTLTDAPIASDSSTLDPGPWGLGFMKDKNILFAACATDFQLGIGYEYGRIYLLNPNTGEILDTINTAEWNFAVTGVYNTHGGGTASGYTSTYNVDFDENYNVYSQSYFGWTVDKWLYSGTLPTIPLTITGIEREENVVPSEFSLQQNYPNPFNPSTTIKFSLTEASNISLNVYSITGELVTQLINSTNFAQGSYKITFDASKLSSGTYIYTLKSGNQLLSKKMTLLK